jgi:cobalamin biosynthesis protein CbiM
MDFERGRFCDFLDRSPSLRSDLPFPKRTNRSAKGRFPLMGIMAAFIFAAQMINFPVAGGTSGHLLGGALAAIVLGPWAGMLVMTAVIAVQALLFQDGGLLVMGANIFNMGLVTAAIGYGLYRSVMGKSENGETRLWWLLLHGFR